MNNQVITWRINPRNSVFLQTHSPNLHGTVVVEGEESQIFLYVLNASVSPSSILDALCLKDGHINNKGELEIKLKWSEEGSLLFLLIDETVAAIYDFDLMSGVVNPSGLLAKEHWTKNQSDWDDKYLK